MEKAKVLLVDDESVILETLVELFGGDYRLFTAGNATEAMSVIDREKVHVIVSDYKIPGKDGLHFLMEAKKKSPNTALALMTAYADMNLVIRAMNEGEIDRFISKPFKSFEFRRILDECIRLTSIREKKDISATREKLVVMAHDSKMAITTIRLLLSTTYRLITTHSGLEVLSLISSEPTDALILGVSLEGMDGCTLTTYLKKEKHSSFPIIIWGNEISGPFEDYLRECGAERWFDSTQADSAQQLRAYLKKTLR